MRQSYYLFIDSFCELDTFLFSSATIASIIGMLVGSILHFCAFISQMFDPAIQIIDFTIQREIYEARELFL
jgi:hypothetical protein